MNWGRMMTKRWGRMTEQLRTMYWRVMVIMMHRRMMVMGVMLDNRSLMMSHLMLVLRMYMMRSDGCRVSQCLVFKWGKWLQICVNTGWLKQLKTVC